MSDIFTPIKLGNLTLKNRIIRAGCFEGMCVGGKVSDKLIKYHVELAKGGCGMTTLSYAAVCTSGLSFSMEIHVGEDTQPGLTKLAEAVHEHDCAISIQLSHAGYFASPEAIKPLKSMGATRKFNWFRLSYCREMTEEDIFGLIEKFRISSKIVKESGFDCIELHCGHGYLLSQFLSYYTNKRNDKYGGKDKSNRARFPRLVLEAMRKEVGDDFPIIIKMNLYDNVPSGVTLEESIYFAKVFEKAGATAIIPSCGFTSAPSAMDMLTGHLPVKEMAKNRKSVFERLALRMYGSYIVDIPKFTPLFLLEKSFKLKKEMNIPVIYVGGVTNQKEMMELLNKYEFHSFQIGRWLINEPDFPNTLKAKIDTLEKRKNSKEEVEEEDSISIEDLEKEIENYKSKCYKCNQCVTSMERDHGLCCMIKRKRRLGIKREKDFFTPFRMKMCCLFILLSVVAVLFFIIRYIFF